MAPKSTRIRTWLITSAVVAGAGLGTAGIASAASTASTNGTSAPSSTTAPPTGSAPGSAPAADPAAMAHGPNETVLTGSDLASATDAAKAAVSGATAVRAETDSAGSAFEVHMKKSDGTFVTVKLDSSFKVTSTDQGFGPGPAGSPAPDGQAPASGTTTN